MFRHKFGRLASRSGQLHSPPELKGGLLLWSEFSPVLAPKPSYIVMCTQLRHLLWVKGSDGSSFLLDRNWRSVLTSWLPAANSQALSAELNICYETADTTVGTNTTPGPDKARNRFRLLALAETPFFSVLSRCAPGPMHPPVLQSSAYRAFKLIIHSQLVSRYSAVTPSLPHLMPWRPGTTYSAK